MVRTIWPQIMDLFSPRIVGWEASQQQLRGTGGQGAQQGSSGAPGVPE